MYELNPQLYNFIFKECGAYYKQMSSDKVQNNIDNSENETKQYLGTYFPDSYKEAYTIFKDIYDFMNSYNLSVEVDKLEILDFCSGSGAELFGFIQALSECITDRSVTINIHSIEGNKFALEIQKKIFYSIQTNHRINIKIYNIKFNNSDEIVHFINQTYNDNFFNIIMSFKSLCEFLKDDNLVYLKFLNTIQNKLNNDGLYILVDVACEYKVRYNNDFYNKYVPTIINENIKEYYQNKNHLLNIIIPFCCFLNKKLCNKRECYTKTVLDVKFITKYYNGYINLKNKLDIFHYNLFIKNGNINNFLRNSFAQKNNLTCNCSNKNFNTCYCYNNIKFTKYFYNNFFSDSQFTLKKYKDYL